MSAPRTTICAASLTLCLLMSNSIQAAPNDVNDLVGVRASSGERELEERGYYHRNNLTVKNGIIGYWWNPGRQACIAVTTTDGRYKSIINQPERMCDDEHSGSGSHSGGAHGSSVV